MRDRSSLAKFHFVSSHMPYFLTIARAAITTSSSRCSVEKSDKCQGQTSPASPRRLLMLKQMLIRARDGCDKFSAEMSAIDAVDGIHHPARRR